jgi:hypothetical protein
MVEFLVTHTRGAGRPVTLNVVIDSDPAGAFAGLRAYELARAEYISTVLWGTPLGLELPGADLTDHLAAGLGRRDLVRLSPDELREVVEEYGLFGASGANGWGSGPPPPDPTFDHWKPISTTDTTSNKAA